MPLRQAVSGQLVVAPVVAEVIEIPLAHTRSLGVGMEIAQGVQGTLPVGDWKTGTVVALLPKVPAAVEETVEAHGGVPIQPRHDLGQVFWSGRFQQIVHMVAHDAERRELEPILLQTHLDGVQEHFAAGAVAQTKLPVVATDSDMGAQSWLEITWSSGHAIPPSWFPSRLSA
jgi:hypothetical protein